MNSFQSLRTRRIGRYVVLRIDRVFYWDQIASAGTKRGIVVRGIPTIFEGLMSSNELRKLSATIKK
jgi:hypothetical protein